MYSLAGPVQVFCGQAIAQSRGSCCSLDEQIPSQVRAAPPPPSLLK
ncbi:hypothetical protein PLANPX_3450 [Lacipirellula parvula]|uniref:Uncharacterized protein n=1 Tax=Lacipirellula parvula TaxID=2650471 RepID=A0A5K7XBF7_9BACT|nr:hypothetical protein PLANPX_3450 [Lacipirellula parvula]